MGIIQQQALKGTFFLYSGVVIGFLSTIAITHSLSSSQYGLVSLLISYSDILSQVATLGFPIAIGRLFSYFRNPKKQHNGFFFIILIIVILLGSTTGLILYYSLKPLIQTSK